MTEFRNKIIILLAFISIFLFIFFIFFDIDFQKEEGKLINLVVLPHKTPSTAKLTFVGDIMVDRHIRKIAEANSYDYLFNNVRQRLSESDLVIGNLEGPITNYPSIYESGPNSFVYSFTFDKKIMRSLLDTNIKIVSLGNNHIENFGIDGVKQTIENLTGQGIEFFGASNDKNILYKEINRIKFAFVSYNQFDTRSIDQVIEDIKTSNDKTDYVIVFTHWGDEYEPIPNTDQIALAHKFIDNGADIIIGTHPHVIQSKENYKGKNIYYSLGNFIFDQYFNKEVSCGAVVTFNINKNEILSVKEKFVSLDSQNVVSFSDCKNSISFLIE